MFYCSDCGRVEFCMDIRPRGTLCAVLLLDTTNFAPCFQ
jgi:hypothetical protein